MQHRVNSYKTKRMAADSRDRGVRTGFVNRRVVEKQDEPFFLCNNDFKRVYPSISADLAN